MIPDQSMDAPQAASRPFMEGYGIATDTEGMVPWRHAHQRLTESRNYWIVTTRPDGRPHAMPVWGVWLNDTLYFGTHRRSRKARNLAANPDIVVNLESGDDAVIIEGIAEEITDPAIYPTLIEIYGQKYPPFKPDPLNEPDNIYYAVHPRVVFAWQESDFPHTATRWRFDQPRRSA